MILLNPSTVHTFFIFTYNVCGMFKASDSANVLKTFAFLQLISWKNIVPFIFKSKHALVPASLDELYIFLILRNTF